MKLRPKIIGIGASAGGVNAIQEILRRLNSLDIPIVVVQHMPPESTTDPVLVYNLSTQTQIVQAIDKLKIENGKIYFAPPSYHLLVEKDFSFSLTQDELVNHSRPSIDVFFESMLNVYGSRCCGVILTGANCDGAFGLKLISDIGGTTAIQTPESAEIPFMPQFALDQVYPNYLGDLAGIADFINDFGVGNSL